MSEWLWSGRQRIAAGEDVERRELLYIVDGSEN